jgi:hypothetical protein
MKLSRTAPLLCLAMALGAPAASAASSFKATWDTVRQGPYTTLPQYQTTYGSLFDGDRSLLEAAAWRTLDTDADILPWFQKLVHPTGICFAGTWSIMAASPYTGSFANGTRNLIIARASEALGAGAPGDYRAFGLAGKLFPTTDASDETVRPTANFFTVDDLGGTLTGSYLDEAKTNKPKTSFHLSQLAIFPLLTEIARTFQNADSDPGVRQVYEIAELGLADPDQAVTPVGFALVPETTARVEASDYRLELRTAHYAGGLQFGIYVSDGDDWTRIGDVKLTQDALSDGCDHRLHFHHPKTK